MDINGGALEPGDTITYTVTITNTGDMAQADNAGNELEDVIPANALYVLASATATSGTAAYGLLNNRITWNGPVNTGVLNSVVVWFSVIIWGLYRRHRDLQPGQRELGLRRQRYQRHGRAQRQPRHPR